jgi:phosphate transport system protein
MSKHLRREIGRLKRQMLTISAAVEESVHEAVKALQERDERLANSVIEGDLEIDRMEVDMEEECLKVLALNQPVGSDLRLIIAMLKINSDLERIGDLAVNIAERAAFVATQATIDMPLDFQLMAEKTKDMLRKSLDALVDRDSGLAHEVCAADDAVDHINQQMYVQIQDAIRAHPDQMESLIHLLSASRHLERIGDHATNIAEDVIYMIEGEIVRHRAEDYRSSPNRSENVEAG